ARLPEWAFARQIHLVLAPGHSQWVETFAQLKIPVLGPREACWSALSGRRALREILRRAGLKGMEGESFTDRERAERYLAAQPLPLWLRSETGPWYQAVLVRDRYSAFRELGHMFEHAEGNAVSIERAHRGPLLGLALLTDGETGAPFGVCRVQAYRFEGETGPLTEGMGAWAPGGPAGLEERLWERIGRPLLSALRAEGLLHPGFVQLRLKIADDQIFVEEIAWGLDDLHAATVLPLWEGELGPVLAAAARGTLSGWTPRWKSGYAVCVVLAAPGYPLRPQTGYPVGDVDAVDTLLFHQATCLRPDAKRAPWPGALFPTWEAEVPGEVVADGGRALFVVGCGKDLPEARDQAYRALGQLRTPYGCWRTDIGAEES
ncbi:MAG: phosphoribosylglycinamide synthetase C domain-containing protein, partial [Chloroflexia bacterium]